MSEASTHARLSTQDRAERGRAARRQRPRTSLGEYQPDFGRQDPVAVLAQQEENRVPALLPLRHRRMAQGPFAFLRGAAAVMAADLAAQPSTGLMVQACGDAHLANIGVFAAPDRGLVFDLNDFDETHPGPFEWDVLRLATSFVVAAREAGLRDRDARDAARVVGRSYREAMGMFAGMNELDVWYYRIDTVTLRRWAERMNARAGVQAVRRGEHLATSRDRWSAVRKLTVEDAGVPRFRDEPPLLVRVEGDDEAAESMHAMYEAYRSTLLVDRAQLLARYRPVDIGHKVVGVGSVGLLAFVSLLQGRDADDLLVLQFKEAVPSVLERHTEPSTWSCSGERVVNGQRLMQAATDAFLGWVNGPTGRSFYVRQLRDMKWSPETSTMDPAGMRTYAGMCGVALARAHARSGDSIAISAYMGRSDKFDSMVQSFASSYADQNDRDFARYSSALTSGEVVAEDDPYRNIRIKVRTGSDGIPRVEESGSAPASVASADA